MELQCNACHTADKPHMSTKIIPVSITEFIKFNGDKKDRATFLQKEKERKKKSVCALFWHGILSNAKTKTHSLSDVLWCNSWLERHTCFIQTILSWNFYIIEQFLGRLIFFSPASFWEIFPLLMFSRSRQCRFLLNNCWCLFLSSPLWSTLLSWTFIVNRNCVE